MKTRLGWLIRSSLCTIAAFAFTFPVKADGPQWVEIRSPHFSVITDAGEKRGREVAMRFEQMRAVFGTLFNQVKVNLPIPLQIVAFHNTREFRQFAPLWHGKPTEASGLFLQGQDRSFIMLDMSVEDPWKVVFHEYGHQLLDGNITQHRDPWFEEGFAEYFSNIEVDNKEARVGKPPAIAIEILRQNGMMKIADLFRVQHNSAVYNESGDHRTVFYVESNLMVHYLYDNKLIPKAAAYFDLKINHNVPVDDAIQQAFGMSAAQFDKVFRNYVTGNNFMYFRVPTPPDIVTTGYTVAPVSAADSNAVLADIHLHSSDYQDKAIAEFQDILKEDPNNAAACRGLGYGYLRKHQYDDAGKYFRRAAQLNSQDPRVHYYSGLLLSREGSFVDRSRLPETIKELETAIALDPNFADSYMLLGFAQAYSGDPAKGLETMKKAISLNPRNESYQYNLAQLYIMNRKFDQGIAILHALQKTQNPQLAMRVQQSLAQAERIQEMAHNGPIVVRPTQSQELENSPSTAEGAGPIEPAPAPPKNVVPIKSVQGTITAVDCSAAPSAALTVVSAAKTWKMTVADTNHMLLFGAQKFSCSWNKQKVFVNYRETGDGQGNVVTLEIQ